MSLRNTDDTAIRCHLEKTDEVFRNDLLMEIILSYVIHGQRNEICLKNLSSVRLVQKHWLKSVSILIRRSRKHIFDLEIIYNSLITTKESKLSETKLDRFTSTLTSANHLEISLLPASVFIIVDYFRDENYNSLLSFFTKCGQHLKALHIEFPLDGGSMPVSFPQFTLPNLKDVGFQFTDLNRQEELERKAYGDNRNGLAFLQLILNSSPNLREFELSFCGESIKSFPINFEYLRLPETVTSIILTNELTALSTKFFLQNKLPHLQEVMLTPEDSDIGHASLFNVLDRFRKTLKYLSLSDGDSSLIRFPVMESLEILEISNTKFEVDSRSSVLQKCMPKLKTVNIMGHVESCIAKMRKLGGFTSVEEIEYEFLEEQNETTSVNFQMMEKLHTAFPNLQRLSMCVYLRDMSALQYVLGQMKHLKTLEIKFCGGVDTNTTSEIESVLLGLSNETKQPSLLNLSELRKLHLTSEDKLTNEESSLLTDLLFEQGLRHMASLQMSLLSGKFKPTIRMKETWRDLGRFMEYREGVDETDDQVLNPYELSESLQ